MSSDCIFCKIVQGVIPCHKVYEDAYSLAFLDIRPLARGHALVIPKDHAARLEQMGTERAAHLMQAVHALVPRLVRAVGATATTIGINNGTDAGQEVPHVHVHVVPRTPGDDGGPIHAAFSKRPEIGSDELSRLAAAVRAFGPRS